MNSIYSSKPWLTQYKTPAKLPVPDWSMIDAFERSVREAPDKSAIYHFDDTISFARLDDLAGRFAALLGAWGIGKGDRVAVSLQNDPEFAIAELGAWKRGAILVPLNQRFKEKEVGSHLAESAPRAWVAPACTSPQLADAPGSDSVLRG